MDKYHIFLSIVILILISSLFYVTMYQSGFRVGIQLHPANSDIKEIADLINALFDEQKPYIKMALAGSLSQLKSMPLPRSDLSCKEQIKSAENRIALSPTKSETALNILKVISRVSCHNDKPNKEKIMALLESTIDSL